MNIKPILVTAGIVLAVIAILWRVNPLRKIVVGS